jgi:hypothetical protein
MDRIGFSTGALGRSDYRYALRLQERNPRVHAIELSALRDWELAPLATASRELKLDGFQYVSFHAPSKLPTLPEGAAFDLLFSLPSSWPIIVHPDIMKTPQLWRRLGPRLCIENMDTRKTDGRTVSELDRLFSIYPEASFCLDVGHARQVDPTMSSAIQMLQKFAHRLKQVHVSDVGPRGEHLPVRTVAMWSYERIAHRIPLTCPLIIESVIEAATIERELDNVSAVFRSWPR